ncbi:MAG: DUF2207 domain-containing protein [Coriobacteriales bacterium]|nr:DUF2207 domain-containing protein [Coriobacteriales bacterium]
MKRFFRIVFLALFLLICCPTSAFAREMTVDAVQIDARVGTDGSLSVTERRTFDVRGSYNGLYWDVHEGSYQGREIRATLGEVLAITGGEQVLLEEGQDGVAGTYELTDMGDYLRLKIFWPAEDETVAFQVSYDLTNLPTRWADVGELYWQYVPADLESEGEWQNVSMTLHLPVPDGEKVAPGENVRAWGHGPLDSLVTFESDSVKFFSPGVGSAEFLEARVTFPEGWLPGVPSESEAKLEEILAEEDQWAKDANAKRRKARLIVYGIPGGMCAAGILSVFAMKWLQKRGSKLTPKAQFTDKYFRDVPTNDHPAVLGMLYRDGRIDGKDFSATLMHLADQGRIAIDSVLVNHITKRGGQKQQQEWRMLLRDGARPQGPSMRAGGKKIDDAAFSFLSDTVADKHKHVIDPLLMGPSGELYVLKSFFDETADQWPQAYAAGYDHWADSVRSAYARRNFKKEIQGSETIPGILGLGDFAIAVVVGFIGMLLGVPNLWLCIAIIVCFGAGIYIVLADEDTPSLVPSQEAVDVRAKLEALKNWLVDFTRLEEAIPTDVVLWNRLLVMATELGVADKVVKQLKVAAPQILANEACIAHAWIGSGREEFELPMEDVGRSAVAARGKSSKALYHEVSTYDTASSSDSSSRGSGGGFSSGGGGGFSGGGGRGGGF